MTDFPRPDSCPPPGKVEAFDAGWNAHRAGLSRKTVEVLSGGMALVAWDARNYMAGEVVADTPPDPPPQKPPAPEQLTIEDAIAESELECPEQ